MIHSKDFAVFAETCFEKFGDRVKHWITFNEPHTFSIQGYDVGLQAPGRCSIILHLFCRAGNSATEPYIVAHNVLLSHATVANIYRKKYKVRRQFYTSRKLGKELRKTGFGNGTRKRKWDFIVIYLSNLNGFFCLCA